ncbi:ash family protein [Sodalis ligni]|uniref:ash family protein n=1 Tax=Sodalis ligni TaxID=2697027 RepID=UPI001404C3B3
MRHFCLRPALAAVSYRFLTSMVGWAGAPQGAPVANEAGKTNSVQSTTRKIGLFRWRLYQSLVGGCLYGYNPHPKSRVIFQPPQFNHGFHRADQSL